MSRAVGLTARQVDALFIVSQTGRCSAGDLAMQMRSTDSAARSRLNGLEARGLVSRTYTGHHRGSSYAYEVTRHGDDALAALDLPDDYDPEDVAAL